MMNMEMYFPTPVWWGFKNLDNEKIKKFAYDLKFKDPVGRKLSNQGGWQSMDFRPGTYNEVRELEDAIMEQANQCVKDFGYNQDTCFVILENLWVNINQKGDTNSVHIHDNSFVSGAYYVKATEDQGSIIFYKSYNQDFITASQAQVQYYTALSASAIAFKPETGKLVMFPGWLPHGVERNSTDEDRISISFNVKIIRTDDERYWPTNTK